MSAGTILIVEDNPEVRETLQDVFELEGFRVRTAEDGEVGLRLLDEIGRPCLIVLDLMMPVMDGWQFLEALRTRPQGARDALPVVVLSGVTDALEMDDIRALYDCMVMRKPPHIDVLLERARASCQGDA